MRLLVLGSALILALAACGSLRRTPPENSGLGAITAITMAKTPCYGTCPAYAVRFSADGRVRFAGYRYAALQGRFSGVFDFAPLAAWIATQHPETLPDTFPNAMVDAQTVSLTVDYGARRVRFTGVSETSASLRLEGILLALDGAISRIHWRREDPATGFLGSFRGGETTLHVVADSTGGFSAYTTPGNQAQAGCRITRDGNRMRLRCATRTSVLQIAGDDIAAEGDAVPPGRYVRINPYAVSPDNRMDSRRRPAE
jgi:hypothetical protein